MSIFRLSLTGILHSIKIINDAAQVVHVYIINDDGYKDDVLLCNHEITITELAKYDVLPPNGWYGKETYTSLLNKTKRLLLKKHCKVRVGLCENVIQSIEEIIE